MRISCCQEPGSLSMFILYCYPHFIMSSTGGDRETITIKYNKCHQMSSSTSAHQSWVTTDLGPIWSMSDRHRSKIFVTKLLKFYFLAARNLVCFSHSTGDQTKDCDQTRGFKTCFTRYNSGIYNRLKFIQYT